MKTTSKRSDWLLTLPLAAAAVAYVVFVFLPGRRATGELTEQIDSKQETIDQALSMHPALLVTRKEVDKTKTYTSAWEERAPARGELSLLHARIRELAAAAGTTITRFDPERAQIHGFLREIPLSVGCSGGFSQVFKFLQGLEGLPPTIWINELILEKMDTTKGYISCEMELVVFTNNPENSDYVKRSE